MAVVDVKSSKKYIPRPSTHDDESDEESMSSYASMESEEEEEEEEEESEDESEIVRKIDFKVDGSKPVKKKKMNQVIRAFVHHVCSPVSNEKRRKAVARILSPENNFSPAELGELWKGMFYVVWYTEVTKCEELIYDVAYGCRYSNEKDYHLAGFKLLAREWMGIDSFRVDKYCLLVRHLVNRCLRLAILESEPRDFNFINCIFEASQPSIELTTHIFEVYLEELKNVTMRKVIWDADEKSLVYLNSLKPIIKSMAKSKDGRALRTIKEYIFQELGEFLSTDCESKWRTRFYQDLFKELIDTGADESLSLKNRKYIFDIASYFKRRC